MKEPKYCICCGDPIHWVSDWDARNDYCYEQDGVIGLNICSSIKCSAHLEIRELAIIEEDRDELSIKYYNEGANDIDTNIDCINTVVDKCLFCSESLETNSVTPIANKESDESIETNKSCPKCKAVYKINDLYAIEDLYSDKKFCLDIYDSRTVIIEA